MAHIDEDLHDFFRLLAKGEDGAQQSERTFGTMREAFLFAFGVGVSSGRRLPIGKSREIFKEGFKEADWDLFRAVAMAENRSDLTVLTDEAQLLSLAEEYANAGIRLMRKSCDSGPKEEGLALLVLDQLSNAPEAGVKR